MTENQGLVTGAGSQGVTGERTEASIRGLRIQGVETCQGGRQAGRVWEGLGSKLCSRSWLSRMRRKDRSASPGIVEAVLDSGPGLGPRGGLQGVRTPGPERAATVAPPGG